EASKQRGALSPLAGEIAELGSTKEGLAQLERGSPRPLEKSAPTPLPGPPPQGGRGTSFTVGALRRRIAFALAERSGSPALDARLGLADRAAFLVGNWADAVAGTFDIVVSNPPYIPSQEIDSLPLEVRGFDPHIALDGGIDGLSVYRAIIPDLEGIVKRDGRV